MCQTVKKITHQRRGHTNSVDVHCESSTKHAVKKDIFLSNKKNKQCFIYMLSEILEAMVCQVIHATGDADLLIAQTAVSVSDSCCCWRH